MRLLTSHYSAAVENSNLLRQQLINCVGTCKLIASCGHAAWTSNVALATRMAGTLLSATHLPAFCKYCVFALNSHRRRRCFKLQPCPCRAPHSSSSTSSMRQCRPLPHHSRDHQDSRTGVHSPRHSCCSSCCGWWPCWWCTPGCAHCCQHCRGIGGPCCSGGF